MTGSGGSAGSAKTASPVAPSASATATSSARRRLAVAASTSCCVISVPVSSTPPAVASGLSDQSLADSSGIRAAVDLDPLVHDHVDRLRPPHWRRGRPRRRPPGDGECRRRRSFPGPSASRGARQRRPVVANAWSPAATNVPAGTVTGDEVQLKSTTVPVAATWIGYVPVAVTGAVASTVPLCWTGSSIRIS